MEIPGFCGGTFESLVHTAEQELTVNLVVTDMESPHAASKRAMYTVPGLRQIASFGGSGVGRGHYFNGMREFAVIGTSLVEIDSAGNLTTRGSVAADANPAQIVANGAQGDQLLVTSGANGYRYDLTADSLAAIATLSGVATFGSMCDGYFLALDGATSTLYVSPLLDGTTWSASQIAQRSLAPDPWVSLAVLGRYVWLLGEFTSEVWYNVGAASSFPFAPYSQALIQHGCAAPFSAAVAGDSLCWLQQTRKGGPRVVATTGFNPEIISTTALEETLATYPVVSDAQGESFTIQGHTFYSLTFPSEDITWVYDLTSKTWTRWATWISEDLEFVARNARWHAFAFGQHRTLAANSGAIYSMSSEYRTDVDERPIRWLRRAPVMNLENQRVYHAYFELFMDAGLGLTTGQGSDPQVMMRMSNDSGRTWGGEQWRTTGARGEYGRRARWERCGMARQRVYEVSGTDPVPNHIIGAGVGLAGDAVRAAR